MGCGTLLCDLTGGTHKNRNSHTTAGAVGGRRPGNGGAAVPAQGRNIDSAQRRRRGRGFSAPGLDGCGFGPRGVGGPNYPEQSDGLYGRRHCRCGAPARSVYIILQKECEVCRNTRCRWKISRITTIFSRVSPKTLGEFSWFKKTTGPVVPKSFRYAESRRSGKPPLCKGRWQGAKP